MISNGLDDSRNSVAQCAGSREMDTDVLAYSVQADQVSMGEAQVMFWEKGSSQL